MWAGFNCLSPNPWLLSPGAQGRWWKKSAPATSSVVTISLFGLSSLHTSTLCSFNPPTPPPYMNFNLTVSLIWGSVWFYRLTGAFAVLTQKESFQFEMAKLIFQTQTDPACSPPPTPTPTSPPDFEHWTAFYLSALLPFFYISLIMVWTTKTRIPCSSSQWWSRAPPPPILTLLHFV